MDWPFFLSSLVPSPLFLFLSLFCDERMDQRRDGRKWRRQWGDVCMFKCKCTSSLFRHPANEMAHSLVRLFQILLLLNCTASCVCVCVCVCTVHQLSSVSFSEKWMVTCFMALGWRRCSEWVGGNPSLFPFSPSTDNKSTLARQCCCMRLPRFRLRPPEKQRKKNVLFLFFSPCPVAH